MALRQFASLFWPGDGVEAEAPAPGSTGYTNAAVIGSFALTLPPGVWVRLCATLLRWWIITYRHYVPERLYILARVVKLLWSKDYQRARGAVRSVAVSGLSNRKLWGEIGNRMGKSPHEAENVYRHFLALETFGEVAHQHRYERNATLELAWLAMRERHH